VVVRSLHGRTLYLRKCGLLLMGVWAMSSLQDHFRKVCTPNYVNVFRDRGGVIGVVEFDSPEDLSRAIRKLDDTEFRNPFERAYIRVHDDSDAKKARGYSRSRSRSRGSR
jgi:arginine/serine-rich splicing factor 1/9